MGTYHYLLNETKKQRVEYDGYIKSGPIQYNEAVHTALVNYMFENQGDTLRFVNDCVGYDDKMYGYEEINLKEYKFKNEEVTNLIKEQHRQIESR